MLNAQAGASGAAIALTLAVMAGSALWYRRAQRGRRAAASPRPSSFTTTTPCIDMPAGLDGTQVLEAARTRFMRLQAAWDAGDVSALRSLTTPDMLEELLHMLPARGSGSSRTDVVTLHAELLGLEELSADYLACVEFSGLICESVEQGAVPFRELWMLAGTKDDSAPSWRLARQQALL